MTKAQTQTFVVCINNEGFPASLEKRKLYVAVADAEAKQLGLLRVVDESGEDYLYPEALFRPIELPPAIGQAVLAAA
jgi:hypothetical protein